MAVEPLGGALAYVADDFTSDVFMEWAAAPKSSHVVQLHQTPIPVTSIFVYYLIFEPLFSVLLRIRVSTCAHETRLESFLTVCNYFFFLFARLFRMVYTNETVRNSQEEGKDTN